MEIEHKNIFSSRIVFTSFILVLILVSVQGVSAYSVSKFDTDGMLNISQDNGTTWKRYFPLQMAQLCEYSRDGGAFETCDESLTAMENNMTIDGETLQTNTYWDAQESVHTSHEQLFTTPQSPGDIGATRRNHSYLVGYMSYPNEAVAEADVLTAISWYNSTKLADPNHIVYAHNWNWLQAGHTMDEYSDVGANVIYGYHTGGAGDNYTYIEAPSTFIHILPDWLSYEERSLRIGFTTREEVESIEELPIPLWLTIEAFADYWNDGKRWWPFPEKELRSNIYWAITVGYTGFDFWGYKVGYPNIVGLEPNATEVAIFNRIGQELSNSTIQDILLLPTLNYSWNTAISWDNAVTFSNNPNASACLEYTPKRLTYRLKYNSTSDNYYLIVANKANVSVTTDITVSGLGNKDVTTVSVHGTGNSSNGRSLSMVSDTFSDTIDAYGGIIYQISSPDSPSSTTEYSICFSGCNATWYNFIIEGQ